jgi:small-conductance mechanosensitive channel
VTTTATIARIAETALSAAEDDSTLDVTLTPEPGVCTELGSFCERLYAWTGNEQFAETTAWVLGTPLQIGAIFLVAALINRIARKGIARLVDRIGHAQLTESVVSASAADRTAERGETIGALLRSTASAFVFGIAAVMALEALGVSIIPILASLGVAGIALGFGAQTLIEDLIAGVMLAIEDQFGVGDEVDLGMVEGTVERLTLRSTVLLDSDGVRWYVPNSEIRRVANESQHKGRAKVQFGVAYEADLPTAMATLHAAATELVEQPEWHDAGVETVRAPFVAVLSDNAVMLEVRVDVDASHRGRLERALRLRLLEAATRDEIKMPSPKLDVWLHEPHAGDVGEPNGRRELGD